MNSERTLSSPTPVEITHRGRRLKRGGDTPHLSLDFESAESELARAGLPAPGSPESMEEFFEKEWMRSLFSLAELFPQELCKCSHVWIVRGDGLVELLDLIEQ